MAARTFEDSKGAFWEVFEVRRVSEKPGAVSVGLEQGWLTFVNGSDKRRLAPFPSEWINAPERELERLCALARVAPPPRESGGSRATSAGSGRTAHTGTRRDATRAPLAPNDDESDVRFSDEMQTNGAFASGDRSSAIERAVRRFAREARAMGRPAIEAMVSLKVMLATDFPSDRDDPATMRHARRWFVETFYFERDT